jgi:hypothetical protein
VCVVWNIHHTIVFSSSSSSYLEIVNLFAIGRRHPRMSDQVMVQTRGTALSRPDDQKARTASPLHAFEGLDGCVVVGLVAISVHHFFFGSIIVIVIPLDFGMGRITGTPRLQLKGWGMTRRILLVVFFGFGRIVVVPKGRHDAEGISKVRIRLIDSQIYQSLGNDDGSIIVAVRKRVPLNAVQGFGVVSPSSRQISVLRQDSVQYQGQQEDDHRKETLTVAASSGGGPKVVLSLWLWSWLGFHTEKLARVGRVPWDGLSG